MIARLALCLTMLPGCVMAGSAHQAALSGGTSEQAASVPSVLPEILASLPKILAHRTASVKAAAPLSAGPLTPSAMCEAAIANAEADLKLPARVLASIAMRESARIDPDTGRSRPWPWTINYLGVGHFYETKQQAIAAVQDIQATGGQSVDVGCMQVNLLHHPEAFATLDEAFDPKTNANYAARFLTSLFAALGDWGTAIGAYHSRTPGLGEPYRDQVVSTWAPKDPAVLAKLTFQPMPAVAGPIAGLPMIYAPFAQPGPIQISSNMAYRAFIPATSAYRAFRPITVAYADFSPARKPARARGQPLDLRISQSLMNSGKALVFPKGIIERTAVRPAVAKPIVVRPKSNG